MDFKHTGENYQSKEIYDNKTSTNKLQNKTNGN